MMKILKPKDLKKANLELEFNSFWEQYPLHTNKWSAQYYFVLAIQDGDATSEEIIDGARRYKKFIKESNQYTQHANNWLQSGRWTDEYPVAESTDAADKIRNAISGRSKVSSTDRDTIISISDRTK